MKPPTYDDLLCLGHRLTPAGELSDLLRRRVDRTAQLFLAGSARRVVLSGGRAETEPWPASRAMKAQAIERGVPPDRIVEQPDALDTVAEAIFTRLLVARVPGRRRLLIVTSDFHVDRAEAIFRFVYGDAWDLSFESVPTRPPLQAPASSLERDSLRRFRASMVGLRAGDLRPIVDRFWERHDLYGGPEFEALQQRTRDALQSQR